MFFKDLFLKGKSYYKNGDFKRAKSIYKDVIKLYPTQPKTFNNLALCYIKLNKIDKAIECLEKSLKINSENELIWSNLGKAYYHKGDYERVIDTYKKASKIFPKNAFFWEGMGVAYTHIGDMDNAINVYKKALDLNNKSKSTWINMCIAYSKKGVSFNHNQFSPNTEVSWYFLAKELLYNGLYKDTLDACERALTINPSFNAAYILRNKTRKIINANERSKLIKIEKNCSKNEHTLEERFKKAQGKIHNRIMDLDQPSNIEINEEDNVKQKNKRKERQKKIHDVSKSQKIEVKQVKPSIQDKLRKKLVSINNKYYKLENCYLVIDGANVARDSKHHDRKGMISNLYLLLKKLNSFGFTNYKIICDRSLYYTIDNQEEYSELIKNDFFIETPGGTEADFYILKYAKKKDAFIISNDMFKEFYKIYGKQWIKSKRITFKIIEDLLFFDKIYTVS